LAGRVGGGFCVGVVWWGGEFGGWGGGGEGKENLAIWHFLFKRRGKTWVKGTYDNSLLNFLE